ncbi:hypothetical protein [Vulcanococcus sp.]|uniref:hypothetical protein n=1 Tax=Vulcanococcus sp. TaxID=2856995 RepID=UPI003F694EAD
MPPAERWEARALDAFWGDDFKEHTLSSPDRIRAALAAIAPWMVLAADHLNSPDTTDGCDK